MFIISRSFVSCIIIMLIIRMQKRVIWRNAGYADHPMRFFGAERSVYRNAVSVSCSGMRTLITICVLRVFQSKLIIINVGIMFPALNRWLCSRDKAGNVLRFQVDRSVTLSKGKNQVFYSFLAFPGKMCYYHK